MPLASSGHRTDPLSEFCPLYINKIQILDHFQFQTHVLQRNSQASTASLPMRIRVETRFDASFSLGTGLIAHLE
jgi:hypothetical protein